MVAGIRAIERIAQQITLVRLETLRLLGPLRGN
jgi:hypothetical protein